MSRLHPWPFAASMRLSPRGHTLARVLVVGGVALALYGRGLQFGFSGDDPSGHFRFIEQTPWLGWFTSTPGFFVRPLVFAAYRLLWLLFGGYDAAGFHLVVLGLHIANAMLVGALAATLTRRQSLGWVAALLFVAFPLSHEVATAVDTLAHSLATFWCLLGVCIHARQRDRLLERLATGLIVLLAMLTHENGLILVPLLLTLDLLWRAPRSWRDLLRLPALPYAVLPALYLLWWLQIPKSAIAAPHSLGEVLQNGVFFLQLAAYPFLPFVSVGGDQGGLLVALAAVGLLVTALAARSLRSMRLWALAGIWLFLAAAPAAVSLSKDYLHGSPHVYYLASAPVALLWAFAPVALAERVGGSRQILRGGVAVLLTLAILLPPVPFIRCEVDLYGRGAELVRTVSSQAAAHPPGRSLVFINLPIFFTSTPEHPQGCPTSYPLIANGVGVFLDYVDLRDFIRVNSAAAREARGVAVAEYLPAWPPRYGAALPLDGVRQLLIDNQVYVFDPESWTLNDLSASWQPETGPLPRPLALFGDSLALEDAQTQRDGQQLTTRLVWRLNALDERPVTAFVHLYNRQGELLAQRDAPLGSSGVAGRYAPPAQWQAGDRIADLLTIDLATPLPADGYRIVAGVYDSQTGERLPGRAADGAALPDNVWELELVE